MIPTLDSVTAEFFAFRQAFFAAGGHRKAVKYPVSRRSPSSNREPWRGILGSWGRALPITL